VTRHSPDVDLAIFLSPEAHDQCDGARRPRASSPARRGRRDLDARAASCRPRSSRITARAARRAIRAVCTAGIRGGHGTVTLIDASPLTVSWKHWCRSASGPKPSALASSVPQCISKSCGPAVRRAVFPEAALYGDRSYAALAPGGRTESHAMRRSKRPRRYRRMSPCVCSARARSRQARTPHERGRATTSRGGRRRGDRPLALVCAFRATRATSRARRSVTTVRCTCGELRPRPCYGARRRRVPTS
jgi:hypothetical protein